MSTKDTLISYGLLAAGGVAIAAASGVYGKGSRAVEVPPRGPHLKVDVIPMTLREARREGYVDWGYERTRELGLPDDHVGYYISEMAFPARGAEISDWSSGWYIDLKDYQGDRRSRDWTDTPDGASWTDWTKANKAAEKLFNSLTKVKVGTAFYFNESGFLGTTSASY